MPSVSAKDAYYATLGQIIEARAKDEAYINQWAALLSAWLPLLQAIEVTRLAYSTASRLIKDGCSLGEQWAGIIFVNDRSLAKDKPSISRLIMFILGHVLLPALLSKSKFDAVEMKGLLAIGDALHTVAFFTDAKYPDWMSRLCGMRYVTQVPFSRSRSRMRIFSIILSVMVITRTALTIYPYFSSAQFINNSIPIKSLEIEGEDLVKCPLCRNKINNAACFGPCGHVGCWECSGQWLIMHPSCPLCRVKCYPSQLVPLKQTLPTN